MKQKIHPKYYSESVVKCVCGNTFKTGAAMEKIDVEICNNCHPFYTKKENLVDAAGRVEKFRQKMSKVAAPKAKKEKVTKTEKAEK